MIPAVSAAKGALYRKTMSGRRPESKEQFIMDRKRRSGSERTTGREKNVAGIEERCRPQEVDRTISPVSWLHHIAERFTSPRVRYPLVPQKRSRPLRKGGTLMVLLMLLLVTSKQLRL
jgi:hypothetical protein